MIRNALAALRTHRLRLLLTVLAVTLGVGFIAGTFVFTDSIKAGFNEQFTASADKVDVAVLPAPGAGPADGSGTGSGTGGADGAERTGGIAADRLPVALLPRIRALPGVTDAQGTVRGRAPLIGKDGRMHGDLGTLGISLPTAGPLRRYTVVGGRAPRGAGEAALAEGVAADTGYRTGDRIQVLDPKGVPRPFLVVGVVDLGVGAGEVGMRGAVAFDPATAAGMVGERGYAEIDVAGTVTAAQVKAVAGSGTEVLTGGQLAQRLAKSAGADIKMITTGLLAFGLVALLVAALVIYNTFTILIAQRARELALLRCLGATRRQVFGGVVIESAAVGLTGSVLGLAAGLGLGVGGLALLNALGADLPAGGVPVTARTVVVAMLTGIVVTMVSALGPARRATKVAPLAALRAEPEPGERRFRLGPLRWVVTGLFGAGGLAVTGAGLFIMKPGEAAMSVVAAGGTLFFVAVVAVMPLLVRPLGRLLGGPPARVAGLPGRLAAQNVRRAPGRTATTTIALTVGVGLVSLFAVVGASAKATSDHMIREQFPVDYWMHVGAEDEDERAIPRTVAQALRAQPDLFASVTEVRAAEARFGNGPEAPQELVAAITQASLGGAVNPAMKAGSLRALVPGTVMVSEDYARRTGLDVGRRAALAIGKGRAPVTVTVAAVYKGQNFLLPEVAVPEADFDRYFGRRGDTSVYLNLRDDAPERQARSAIDAAVRPYPVVKVSSATALKGEFDQAIDMMLAIFGALLGLAILIALFGITNTLTLSVVERTRESALLRALGITRRQLRGMLSTEAVIMSLIGALVGIVLGTAFGWAATESLSAGFVFALPYAQIVAFVVLAALAGLLAAVLPARRAAKESIVESLAAGAT